MNEQLKDCPFCGCAATFVKHSAGMPGTQGFDKWDAVACKHCRATVGACDRRFRNREDAADAWNRRIPLAAPTGSESGEALSDAERSMLNFLFRQMGDLGDAEWRQHGFRRATFERLETKLAYLQSSQPNKGVSHG